MPLALLVISGAVDLSVGSVASLAGIIAGMVMTSTELAILGILAGLAVGVGTGAVNGLLVSYFRLNSIVVTLGALSVWGGMALYLTGGQTIAGLPDAFVDLANIEFLGISVEIFVLVAAIIYGWSSWVGFPTVAGCTRSAAMSARPF